MNVQQEVLRAVDEVLSLGGRAAAFTRDTSLGTLLDSMAVVGLITLIQERLDIVIDDDEIVGDNFATVGALVDLVASKLG
ncbi:MAG: acyl carrier protein [Burkholderiaceae bacterium]|jgi:acyl carrier protein|nr:acyl carrier protein [Aquabacterium sp.]MCK6433832.1 acyl carrier protein [Aquabacterium sp.]NUP87821.1 acyl carrier protein [Burkholderiaceae bacterium]